jgi:hypothetical protein
MCFDKSFEESNAVPKDSDHVHSTWVSNPKLKRGGGDVAVHGIDPCTDKPDDMSVAPMS